MHVLELAGPFSGKGPLRLTQLAERLQSDARVIEFEILPRKD